MRLYRVILALTLALSACSGKSATDVKDGGSTEGGAGSSGAAGESSSGGSASSAGGSGSGSGGTAGASAGGESGGASGSGGTSGGAAGGEGELVSCDHRQVLCKSIEPTCPEMQVASITGSNCWGPCVKIELCACASAEECPHEESYTCWSKQHCGPYVR